MMTTLQVAIFRGIGMISALIRWQTRSPYSHAAVMFDDGEIIESWPGKGVQLLPALKRGTDGIEFFDVPVSTGQKQAITTWLLAQLGRKYDYVGVLRFVSRRKATDGPRWFCSELVFEAFRQAGVDLLARTQAWEVSPGLLARSPLLLPAHP